MAKLLLISVLVATATIPALTAKDPMPKRGLARAVRGILLFNVVYALALIFIYPKLSW